MVSLYAMGMPTYHISKKVHKLSIGTCIYVHYYISYSIFISLFPVMKKSLNCSMCFVGGGGVTCSFFVTDNKKKADAVRYNNGPIFTVK